MTATERTSELERLHRASFAWALSCCRGDVSEAEEVLQTAYLKIVDGRARYAGRSTFKTWVFSVVRRTAAERRRRRRLRRALLLRWGDRDVEVERRAGPAAEAARRQRAVDVRAAIDSLSRRQRQVLELVFYQGQTVAEAAAVLAITVGSARVHYARGKKKLLNELGDWSPRS